MTAPEDAVERAARAIRMAQTADPDSSARLGRWWDEGLTSPEDVEACRRQARAALDAAGAGETTTWYTPAWRAENGNVIPFGTETVIREAAEGELAAVRAAREVLYPDRCEAHFLFLAARPVHDWKEVEG